MPHTICALFPFFSAVVLNPERYGYERKVKRVKTLTNAEVEGIMAVEKRNIFNKRKRTMLEKIIYKMSFHHRG